MSYLRLQPALPITIPANPGAASYPRLSGNSAESLVTNSVASPLAVPEEIGTALDQRRARLFRDTAPTGPPPSFQASILEVESDISYAIRQFEAAREKQRGGDATALVNQPNNSKYSEPDIGK